MYEHRNMIKGESVWIIGAGQFGARAVTAVRQRAPAVKISLVDCDAQKLQGWPLAVHTEHGDGIDFIAHRLAQGEIPSMIVPAAPIHIAFDWIRRTTGDRVQIVPRAVPVAIAARLPNPIHGAEGELFTSHADFLCPPDCSEPAKRCTATGRPRPRDMFRLLRELDTGDYSPVVVRSHQLAPGVGGYQPESLFAARTAVARINGLMLLATACRCHGVLHAAAVHRANTRRRPRS